MQFWAVFLLGLSGKFSNEAAVEDFKTSILQFTPTVYKEVSQNTEGNFIVSPFSAEVVLSLLHAGAKEETAKELSAGIHLPNDKTKIEAALKGVLSNLKNKAYTIETANKLYLKPDFKPNEGFKSVTSQAFQAECENVDFIQREAAAKTINSWVEQKTNNKITNLVDSGNLNNRTRAVLVNALYFKADWGKPFLLSDTSKQDFYKNGKDLVHVDTMHSRYGSSFMYFECPHLNAKLLEMPFKHDASLTLVLPNERNGLPEVENQIEQVFRQHHFRRQRVELILPRFKIESEIDLKKVLMGLGITRIFDDKQADLSGIAGKKGDLIVDEAIQKGVIDVNEEGVEAAAATLISVGIPMMVVLNPKVFNADHPFLWYIKVKDFIVVVGRFVGPQ